MLRSYVSGGWHAATDEGRPLHDAVTGEEVARISSTGVDLAGALDHGRRVGGPALRELTFHQRAALLKALGHAPARAPRASSTRSPRAPAPPWATRSSTSTAASGCCWPTPARAAASCPTTPSTSRARSSRWAAAARSSASTSAPRCAGSRCRSTRSTSRCGGRWRSSRPRSWPACRRLVKPASPTAFLTAQLVELIVESGLLPEGALQFVAGGVGDLFDHLTEQDSVVVHRLGVDRGPAAHAPGAGRARRCGSPPRPTR